MLIYWVTLFFLNLRGLEGDNEALMDARSYSRLPPYTRARKISEPFFFAPKPCICGLPTSYLKDAAISFLQ